MLDIIKIAGIYMGIIIGAGFASGQEILRFFIDYGNNWALGIVFSGIIFCVIGGISTKIIYNNKIDSSYNFFSLISNRYLAILFDILSAIFTFILFCAMFSASGALMFEGFGLNRICGSIVIIVLFFIISSFGSDGIALINAIISPLILFIGGIICSYICFSDNISVFLNTISYRNYNFKLIFSAILYSSYNIITGISSLISSKNIIIRNKNTYIGAVIGGLGISILGIFTGISLFLYKESILFSEIPILKIICNSNITIKYLYFIMIILSILSTVLGNGYSFICWIYSKLKINKYFLSFFICFLGLFFSYMKFSSVVSNFYSLFGIFGISIMFYIIIYYIKNL